MFYIIIAIAAFSAAFWFINFYARYWRTSIGYATRRPRGYIYYFTGANPMIVKIGRTKNVLSRLRSHRTANPYGITVLGVVPVYNDVEAEFCIHSLFKDQRVTKRNEWFYLSFRLWWFIRATRDVQLTASTVSQITLDRISHR